MRKEIMGEFRKRINRGKLKKYLKKYENNFKKKVIEILR